MATRPSRSLTDRTRARQGQRRAAQRRAKEAYQTRPNPLKSTRPKPTGQPSQAGRAHSLTFAINQLSSAPSLPPFPPSSPCSFARALLKLENGINSTASTFRLEFCSPSPLVASNLEPLADHVCRLALFSSNRKMPSCFARSCPSAPLLSLSMTKRLKHSSIPDLPIQLLSSGIGFPSTCGRVVVIDAILHPLAATNSQDFNS